MATQRVIYADGGITVDRITDEAAFFNIGTQQGSTLGLNVTGNLTTNGTLSATGNATLSGALTVAGTLTANGNVTLGDANTDTVTATGRLSIAQAPLLTVTQKTATFDLSQTEGGIVLITGTGTVTITFPNLAVGTFIRIFRRETGTTNLATTGSVTINGVSRTTSVSAGTAPLVLHCFQSAVNTWQVFVNTGTAP